jgi:hypothetical protein
MLETGVLLTNVLSNGDRELNASNIENCDKDKVESYFKEYYSLPQIQIVQSGSIVCAA